MTTNYPRDFFKEAHVLLKNQGYRNYIENLLPSGKWKNGEYIVKNPTRNDNKAGSFSINENGKWSDFAIGDRGNDLIGLTAYVKGITSTEACYYIGVPPLSVGVPSLEKSNIKTIPKTAIKTTTEPQLNTEDKYPSKALKVTDKAILELEAIEDKAREPTGKRKGAVTEPPTITAKDTEFHNRSPIPEFTEVDIGIRTHSRFKGGKLSYYRYYSSKGIPVGCIVRCDMDVEGDKVKSFAQFSYNKIKEKWQASWGGEGKPLYNLQEIVTRTDAPVMIVEGEKTAEAAKLLFPEYVITTSCMGSASPRSTNWSFLRNRDVIVAPDNDKTGEKYAKNLNDILAGVGAKRIRNLDVKKLGHYVIVDGKLQQRDEPVPDKYDLADNAVDGWTAELIAKYQEHKDFTPFFEVIKDAQATRELPKEDEECLYIAGTNYKLSKKTNTLWWERVKTDGRSDETTKTWIPLAGYIKPTHCMKDANGDHGLLTEIVTRRGEQVECFFSRDETASEKETTKLLLLKGLAIPNLKPDNCYALNSYLNNFTPEFNAVGVDKVGWQGNNEAYILPIAGEVRNTYQVKTEEKQTEYILQQKGSTSRALHKKGTLEEWKRTVGTVTRGNHLHTFSMLAALTAPILKLLNEEGGFFHYVGATSIGKSTIMRAALSIFGDEKMGTFRATDNNLEGVCKISNDGAIFLDELGECDAEALSRVVYMVANGVTKGRSDRNGNPRPVTHFTVLAQSTGEMGIEAKLAEKRIQAKGGQLLRMGELDADRSKGLNTFDVLNINPDTKQLFKDGKTQAEYLKTHAKENCGVVIDKFMQELVKDIETYKKGLKYFKAEWIASLDVISNQPEIDRMIKRFSTIYATGVVASTMRVLPHTTEEIKACINAVFDNWLERRGGDTPHELKMIQSDLYKLCKQNQHLRFQPARPKVDERVDYPKDKAGYWTTKTVTSDKDGMITVLDEFWIYPRVFDNEVLKGMDKKAFLPLLVKSGCIEKKDAKRYTQKRRPQGDNSQRFYVIPVSAFNGM